jgi:dolichol kinase
MERETKRQLFQIFYGGFTASLIILFGANKVLCWLIPIASAGVVLQIMVIKKWKVPGITHLLNHMERDGNVPGKGAMSMTAGVLLALLLFPQGAAVHAILVVGISDSLSTLVGIRYKIKFFGSKSKEGSVVFFLSALLIGLLLQNPLAAFAAAVFATVAELIPFEDNITIPIAVGLALQIF